MAILKDVEREFMLDLVRVTETAALRAARYMGTGNCKRVDGSAVDGMRGMLQITKINGTIIIGEGEKDQAPMLYIGEQIGDGNSGVNLDIAVDPVEGTRLVANGGPNALSIIVAGDKGCLATIPAYYMQKIAVGPEARGLIDINVSTRENLKVVAAAMGKSVNDLTVCILSRPRHEKLIDEVRKTGSRIKLINDGDVAAGIATALPDSGIDMLIGIGGATEGVLTAAALKCLGGEIQAKVWVSEKEGDMAKKMDPDEVFVTEDLCKGNSIVFAATGITDGDMLKGVRYHSKKASTESVVMRARTKTVRFIKAYHDLTVKTIPSSKKRGEVKI